MKRILLIAGNLLLSVCLMGQTLQTVTENGNISTRDILAQSFVSTSASFAGDVTPSNINSLNGFRINGTIANSSHNGITYQSGGGGGAAISFFRGGSYGTGIDFYTNSDNIAGNIAHRMRIADNGNIGLGTASPRSRLEVNDWVSRLSLVSRKNTEDMVESEAIGAIDFYQHYGVGNSASIKLLHAGNGIQYTSAHLAFYTNGGGDLYSSVPSERMRITSSGNVGIGTADPKGYKLAVAGNMVAESIKVKPQSAWPDYVFSKEYQLPSLKGIEKHIKEQGHLPGIPSATEVKANGVDLGDMNAKLLQKIEELTLHLIEMKKEYEVLKNEVKNIKKIIHLNDYLIYRNGYHKM